MKMAATLCYDCGSSYDAFDNYCRCCGANLRVRRLPDLLPDRRLSRLETGVVATLVSRGVLAFLAARLMTWGVRFAVRRVMAVALATRSRPLPAVARRGQVRDAEPTEALPAGGAPYTLATFTVQHVVPEAGPAAPKSARRRWLFVAR